MMKFARIALLLFGTAWTLTGHALTRPVWAVPGFTGPTAETVLVVGVPA